MRYTVVTGASAGIGRDTAKVFASKGKNVIVIARRAERLEELKQEIVQAYGTEVVICPCDLTDLGQVYKLYEDLKAYDIEIWINNAGIGMQKKIIEQDLKKAIDIIRLNIEAVTALTTLYAQDYKDKEATLINITSTVGYGVSQRLPVYSSTKMYIAAFTEALYWELKSGGYPMRAKVAAAGTTATDFELTASGKALDLEHFVGNTSREVGEWIYRLYESDQALAYADDDCKWHLSGPKIPHTLTKAYEPNLLKR